MSKRKRTAGSLAIAPDRDLRGFPWEEVRAALDAEIAVINRLKAAEDLEAEVSAFEDLQATSFEDEPALWGLDVGVAAATIAISAYGATPVSSCNAGAFGGQHQARYPYVAFFLPKELAPEIMLCAKASDVGLLCDENCSCLLIDGRGEMDSVRFAETAWKRSSSPGTRSPSELGLNVQLRLKSDVSLAPAPDIDGDGEGRQLPIGCGGRERSSGDVARPGRKEIGRRSE